MEGAESLTLIPQRRHRTFSLTMGEMEKGAGTMGRLQAVQRPMWDSGAEKMDFKSISSSLIPNCGVADQNF